jgi:phosphatidate cytidylyltransferase
MPEPASPPPSPSKVQTFLRRGASTVVLWSIILAALFSGNRFISDGVFIFLIALLALSGLVEFYGMAEKRGMVNFKISGVIGGLLLMVGTFLNVTGRLGTSGSPARVNDFETSFLIIFVLGLCVRQLFAKNNSAGLTAIATTLFGLMYVPWLLNFIQKISFFPFPTGSPADAGKFFLLYFILITKFSDMGAYAVGSLIGKHKMIPRISPGKTWEGFFGAIVVSAAASVAFVHFFGARMVGMNLMHAIILGVILSVTAVIGDLIESLFKREAGVKDSGKLFPGIGGILDLLDSLLFNAPLMYLYLRHVLIS